MNNHFLGLENIEKLISGMQVEQGERGQKRQGEREEKDLLSHLQSSDQFLQDTDH